MSLSFWHSVPKMKLPSVPEMKLPADPESRRVVIANDTKAVSITVVVRILLLTEGEETTITADNGGGAGHVD